MNQIICPHCGKTGRTTNPLPFGKQVKCPACKASFRVGEPWPETQELATEEPAIIRDEVIEHLPIKIEIREGVSTSASNPSKPGMGWGVLIVAIGVLAFGGGLLVGSSSKVEAPPVRPPAVKAEVSEVEKEDNEFNRLMNPISVASIYWSEPESTLREICAATTKALMERKIPIGLGEVAAMLVICGRTETAWRGREQCSGADFIATLYFEMLVQGTKSEDAIRILAKLHSVRPGAAPQPLAFDCDQSRRLTYKMLKAGRIITLENTLDQLLSCVHMVQGNEAFRYHRQTGEEPQER
jgi:hypothetical protein